MLLFIALINQGLIMLGKSVLPISEDQVSTLTDTLYLAGSMIFTIVTTLFAWFKNNYTDKGKLQKEVLKQKGLTK
ncbi:phage holin [Bacillus safensis]|uniref:phage holin n=1 Tax=Bacillus safensis TaxID=561879 RepID=UPI003000EF47